MKLSELQKKDIINIKDGRRVGRIVDANVDINSGYMIDFVIEKNSFVKNIFYNNNEFKIKFSQIKKLGEDVILIDIS